MDNAEAFPRIRSVGLDGIVVQFSNVLASAANRAAIAFHHRIAEAGWPEISESCSTLVSAFFRIDLVAHDYDTMVARLTEQLETQDWFSVPLPAGRKLWRIPAVFGTERAPQLEEAAEAAGLSADEAKAQLATAQLRVLTLGFAPGQPYLGMLGEAWDIPRQSQLTPRVPPGALVAAVRQMCLFSNETPTGWRHVGQCAFRCFRPGGANPFPLSPGDEITFEEITPGELLRIEEHDKTADGGAEWSLLE